MCSKTIGKVVLVLLNVVFVATGIAALGLGVFTLVSQDQMMKVFSKIDADTVKKANEYVDVPSLLDKSAYVLIAGGIFIFVLGFLGCVGALKESKVMLVLYAVIIFLILCVEIAAGVMAFLYKEAVESRLKDFLANTIKTGYKTGVRYVNGKLKLSSEPIDIAWDLAQTSMECCGSHNYTDYMKANAENFNNNYTISMAGNKSISYTALVPASCCRLKDPSAFPKRLHDVQFVNLTECLTEADPLSTNIKGCYMAARSKILKYVLILGGIGLGVGLIEILGIVCAIVVCRGIGEKD